MRERRRRTRTVVNAPTRCSPEDAVAAIDYSPMCRRCAASFARERDDLCAECRYEIDEAFADLPGAAA